MSDLRVEELSASNALDARGLESRPGQDEFANPETYINAEQQIDPSRAWSRVIVRDSEVVGVVRAYFDPDYPDEELTSCIWNIAVAGSAQGEGVGRFAVQAVVDEARARHNQALTVMWSDAPGGPGEFFTRLGFIDSGATVYGDRIGVMKLS